VTTYDFVNSKSRQWPALRRSEDGTLCIGSWVILSMSTVIDGDAFGKIEGN
jgi:hypothetical protein